MFESSVARPARLTAPLSIDNAAVLVITITVLGAALRLATLDVQSFYLDETVTADLMRKSFGGMLGALSDSESAPPLYYALLWPWAKLWGTGEVGLRSLSAIFGVAMVPAAYLAAAKLLSVRVGLFTAALVAFNPLLIWYSQEARVYALFALLTALGLAAFADALRSPHGRAVAWWAGLSALSLCTHYFAAFLILPQAVILLRAHGRSRELSFAMVGVAAVMAALLPLAIVQRDSGTDWLSGNSLPARIADTGVQFLVGPNALATVVTGPLAAALVLVGIWLLFRRAEPDRRRAALLAAAIGGVGIGIPLLIALGGVDVYIQKSMIGALLPVAIAIATGFAARRAATVGTASAVLLCALGAFIAVAVATTPTLQRDDWRGAAEALGGSADERLLLVNPGDAGGPHRQAIENYIPSARSSGFDAPVREVDVLSLTDSGLDAQISGVPELPPISAPPGFELERTTTTDRFTLLTYTSPTPRSITGWATGVRSDLERADRGATKALLIPPEGESG